jgi:hypothetical protein
MPRSSDLLYGAEGLLAVLHDAFAINAVWLRCGKRWNRLRFGFAQNAERDNADVLTDADAINTNP